METQEDETVGALLERLKLPEKYLDIFHSNGFFTVKDCHGITEQKLKDIGIVLPGHYRRLLSKIPGSSLSKPPRHNRGRSLDIDLDTLPLSTANTQDDTTPSPSNDADYDPEDTFIPEVTYEPLRILESEESPYHKLSTDVSVKRDDSLYDKTTNHMNSPKLVIVPTPVDVDLDDLEQVNDDDVYNLAGGDPLPPPPGSPSGICEAVMQVMRDSPNSLKYEEEELYATADNPSGSPITTPSPSSPYRTAVTPDTGNKILPKSLSIKHMPLPSPPPPAWMTSEPTTPTPRPLSAAHQDTLHLKDQNTLMQGKKTSPDSLSIGGSSMTGDSCEPSPTTPKWIYPPTESIDFDRKDVEPKVETEDGIYNEPDLPGEKTASLAVNSGYASLNRDLVGNTTSENVSEYAALAKEETKAEEENVYDVCDDDISPKKRVSQKTREIIDRLSRSSSTASTDSFSLIRAKRASPVTTFKFSADELSMSDEPHSENEVYESNEEDIYLSIGDSTEDSQQIDKGGIREVRANTTTSGKASGIRLGRKRKTQGNRPVSAFVESIINPGHSRQSSSEDGDGNATRTPHQRAASTSDGKQSDLVDACLVDEGRLKGGPTVLPLSPLATKKTKKGWLWKQGWHEGRAPYRKRWVVFDGEELLYYESENKTELTKGVIPVEVILRVQVPQSDLKAFHILTKGGRKYIFYAESSDERALWTATLMAAKMSYEKERQGQQFKPGGSMYMPYKEGMLKMDGHKAYLATKGDQFAYYKSNNEFNFGQPVAKLNMKLAAVKEVDKKKFQLVFPYRSFMFTADSEEDKRSWVEALSDAIAESLSDYKVVNEIWENETNRVCADCGRGDPDWASVNLAIVICKHCAGVHRDLGVHNSKVRSLKMDVRIWTESMKMLFLSLGNAVANEFWSSKLKSSDAITDMADKKQRAWHINSKYIEMQYTETLSDSQEQLNQGLINAVRNNDLKEGYCLVFSGADPNCDTSKQHAKTPYQLAKHLGYEVMAEFLLQNGATSEVSPEGHVTNRGISAQKKESLPKIRAKPPVTIRDCLYKYGGDFRSNPDEHKPARGLGLIKSALQQGEFQKRMCVLENNCLKYYDPDKTNVLKDEVDCSDLISIGVCEPEQAKNRYKNCFEVGRNTGRTYLFASDRKEIAVKWTMGLMQAIVPPMVQNAMKQEVNFDRVGKMMMKTQHWNKKSTDWVSTWCRLSGKSLYYFHEDSRTMELIDLRKIAQISLDLSQERPSNTNNASNMKEPAPPVFMLVFREKSYYFHSETRPDTESWFSAIKRADGDCGSDLENQQVTGEGVPIVLEKCMTYVEQFGLTARGIYRLNGTHSKTSQLLLEFQQNARETQMRESDLNVHDVASALKRWFKSLPGSLLTTQLHNEWIDTAEIKQEHQTRKLNWYKHLITKLPDINRSTLKVLLNHLNNVASHEKENEMSRHNLAIVFGPTLMEPQDGGGNGKQMIGQTSQEIGCIEDLLNYYDWLFDVTEVDREKERLLLEAKEKISLATQQQSMLTTLDYDMMVPIYINSKEDKCANYKVNLTAGDLIKRICATYGHSVEKWGLYEIVMDGDAERPLHFTEHVLSVIKSWEMPSTNYLVAKFDYLKEKILWLKQPQPDGHDIIFEGSLRYYDAKKKWNKYNCSLRLTDGALCLWYGKLKGAVCVQLSLYHVYIGIDKKTKPPLVKNQVIGFTLAARGEPSKQFCVDSEHNLFKWVGHILIHKYPGGFTPPPSPVEETHSTDNVVRRTSDNSTKRRGPLLSQQDLGEAVSQMALQRKSSGDGDSDDVTSDPVYETTNDVETENNGAPSSPNSVWTTQSDKGIPQRRSTSFVSEPRTQQRGFLGLKLQNELSSVLKKRTQD